MQISKAVLHLACGPYQFVEAELPFTDFGELLEFVKEVKRKDLEEKYNCPHMFYETYESKAGKLYQECCCGAMRWEEDRNEKEGVKYGQWKIKVHRKE